MAKSNEPKNWRDLVTEVVFDDPLLQTCKSHLDSTRHAPLNCLDRILSEGIAVRMRFVSQYDCYTVSLGYPKDGKEHKGETFWFYWGEPEEALLVAEFLVVEYLVDFKGTPTKLNRKVSFLE